MIARNEVVNEVHENPKEKLISARCANPGHDTWEARVFDFDTSAEAANHNQKKTYQEHQTLNR